MHHATALTDPRLAAFAFPLLAIACGSDPSPRGSGGAAGTAATGPWDEGIHVAASEQRPGDPAAGERALLDQGYVSCGIPASIASLAFPSTAENQIPGREGPGVGLPYGFNRHTDANGAELIVQNCYTCHAGRFNGELVLGLGSADSDYTNDSSKVAGAALGLLSDEAERSAMEKFLTRVRALGANIVTRTVGTNPAENIAAVLVAHRHRDTLVWSDEPLLPIPGLVAPVDPPPWWRMKKKNAMFYITAGRGDQTKHLMLASSLCTDSVAEAEAIYDYFDDVRAFIASLEAPEYPFSIDQALAAEGEGVFGRACAGCHGTYGPEGEYPNLLIPLDLIDTDAAVASGSVQFADELVTWQRESYYGEGARFEPQEGYIAPPLDGVWATAPYLHNGSVPDVDTLLSSSRRPAYWTRTFDSTDFDQDTLGWRYTELEHGQDDEPDVAKKKLIYDTSQLAHSNEGHRFGDALTVEERRAVIEYLKTL